MRQTSEPLPVEGTITNHPENLDMIMSSDLENQISELPPRLAARLHRTARKSAASSRRSSISSLHSSRAGKSSGIHNTHIAHELRRTSIIETRRARLADRAAHAEKVRLRALEVKAAPRMSRGEDRAIAAQHAREQFLAQVASSCAEEVKRAKKVAEEMREKRAAEYAKLRDEMTERLVMAEKRRIQHIQNQRRLRTSSHTTVEQRKSMLGIVEPLTEKAAVKVIIRSWKDYHRRKVLQDFVDLRLDLAHVQSKSFEEVSETLAKEDVIKKTARLMKLCGLQDVIGGPNGDVVAVKTFLSAFLLLGHPRYVLSHEGDREEELMNRAKVLLVHFERVTSKQPTESNFAPTSSMMLSLSEAYSDFQLSFEAWKNHDSTNIVETMLAQFAELDAIWQTVKNDTTGDVAADYKSGIRHAQTVILARLKRLLGHEKALQMANEAVKVRRRTKGAKRPAGDVRPRSASIQQPAIIPKLEEIPQEQSNAEEPIRICSEELYKVISPLPPNRIVVHELMVNKEYRIDADTASETYNEIRRKAFDAMRVDLVDGKGDEWIVSVVKLLREKLLRTMLPGKPLYNQVSEMIDIDLIKDQLANKSFSYNRFFSYVSSILPKLVSPARDSLVKAFAADTSDDHVERFANLLNIVDLLSLDYSNYLIMCSAPELIKHGVSYENMHFAQEVGNGPLRVALNWWRNAKEKAIAETSGRAEARTNSPSSQRIYNFGLVDLFISTEPLREDSIPETLLLDTHRIERTRLDILKMITISSIILTAKNILKRDVRVRWKTQVKRMWDLPAASAFTESTTYLKIVESFQTLPPATKTSIAGTIDRVLADARSAPNITHPVMKVLLQKIKTHILSRLVAGSSEERLRLATSASVVLSSGGLAEFVDRIGGIVEEMGKVRQVDWDTHGKWIDEIAEQVAAETHQT